ncbi:hypothetical protein QTN25_004716 [Entamoeba marina]
MELNGFDEESCDIFLEQIRLGEIDIVKAFVQQDNDILTVRNSQGNSCLHFATANNHLELLKYLLEFSTVKDIINITNVSGSTALHWAVHSINEITVTLLNAGADKSIQNSFGKTALQLAEEADKNDIVDLLISEDLVDETDIVEDIEVLNNEGNAEEDNETNPGEGNAEETEPIEQRNREEDREEREDRTEGEEMAIGEIVKIDIIALTSAQTIPNCAVESNGVCTECDGDYFLLESGLCGSKEKFIGCSEFEDGGCKTCSSNYVKLSSTICMECKSLFAHCSDCDSTQCKECDSGYSLKEVNTGIDGVKMICGSSLPFILMIVAILFVM